MNAFWQCYAPLCHYVLRGEEGFSDERERERESHAKHAEGKTSTICKADTDMVQSSSLEKQKH